eukprot:4532735-Ditylum_brightwellii.AAC.1
MRKQVKRLRTARHLLNALRRSPSMYSPRKHTKCRKSTPKTSFPVPDEVTATKIPCGEFIDVLEDGILYQWKLEFEKEGFKLSSSTFKEFLDVCVHLEEAKLQKPL